jgi:hypothetical protein
MNKSATFVLFVTMVTLVNGQWFFWSSCGANSCPSSTTELGTATCDLFWTQYKCAALQGIPGTCGGYGYDQCSVRYNDIAVCCSNDSTACSFNGEEVDCGLPYIPIESSSSSSASSYSQSSSSGGQALSWVGSYHLIDCDTDNLCCWDQVDFTYETPHSFTVYATVHGQCYGTTYRSGKVSNVIEDDWVWGLYTDLPVPPAQTCLFGLHRPSGAGTDITLTHHSEAEFAECPSGTLVVGGSTPSSSDSSSLGGQASAWVGQYDVSDCDTNDCCCLNHVSITEVDDETVELSSTLAGQCAGHTSLSATTTGIYSSSHAELSFGNCVFLVDREDTGDIAASAEDSGCCGGYMVKEKKKKTPPKESFFNQNKIFILGGVGVAVIVALVIGAIVVRRRRKQTSRSAMELSGVDQLGGGMITDDYTPLT